MARFFKYKTVDELRAENGRLGLSLGYSEDFSVLDRPFAVGDRTIGNRWCIHPMEGCDGELDGTPGELTFRRYRRFGAGGAKLIWGEACAVNEEGRANPRQILLNDRTEPAFRRLVEECREAHRSAGENADTMLFGLQLTHSGRYSYRRPVLATRDPLLDIRTVMDKSTGRTADASTPLMTDDELKRLVGDYVATAERARRCGFDFVDIKQCHRYLVNELLGARNRPGPYGGSLENRTRFATEVFRAVRTAVPDMILATRMNVFDAIPYSKGPDGNGIAAEADLPVVNGWGLNPANPLEVDLTEPLEWIAAMRRLGVSLVNVTMGNPYAQPHFGRPFEYPPPDGYESPEHPLVGVQRHFDATAAIQQAFPDLGVVGTGYSYLQEFLPHAGAANIAAGRVTFVGVGRASLSQPDFARQIREHGRLDRKRICRTFSYCTALMRSKQHPMGQYPTGCPPFDKEAYGDVWKEVQQLTVKPR